MSSVRISLIGYELQVTRDFEFPMFLANEQRVSHDELKNIGRKKRNKRVQQIIKWLEPISNYDMLYVGGSYPRKLIGDLPPDVRIFDTHTEKCPNNMLKTSPHPQSWILKSPRPWSWDTFWSDEA